MRQYIHFDFETSIIDHAAGAGNGDVSRALTLCQTVARYKTMNVAYLIGFFRYFGSINVNLRGDDGKGKVSLMSRDAKGYRGYDVAGAKANNWADAFDADGNRAPWYQGPTPATFEPMTIGDLARDFLTFADREVKKLDAEKKVGDKVVPLVSLNDADKAQFLAAIDTVRRLAATIARHEEVAALNAKAAALAAEKDETIEALLVPQEQAAA